MSEGTVLVVGASAAGLTVAEALRSEGHGGPITILGEEGYLPYDRPPLSKQQLTDADPPDVGLADAKTLAGLDVQMRPSCRAVALDIRQNLVLIEGGESVGFEDLVIATGVRPRRLTQGHDLIGVHVLRGLDDAQALRAALRAGPRVVVVGGGVLGAEVAASSRTLGLDVTWIFPEEVPMEEVVGRHVGGYVADRHERAGVRLRPGLLARSVVGAGGVTTGVEDHTGAVHLGDVVVVCIGSVPNVEWLASSGLSLTDGVDCDEFGRARERIYAVGDVASWLHPASRARVRIEHRMNATAQGLAVAHNIVHGPQHSLPPTPYFWTDQYGARLQVFGSPSDAQEFRVTAGSFVDGRFAGVWMASGVMVAAGGIGMPRAVRELQQQLAGGGSN